MRERPSITRNAWYLAAGQAVNRTALVAFIVVLARLESEAFVGWYSVAVVIASLVLRVVLFGTPVLVVREVAAHDRPSTSLRRLAQRAHLVIWAVVAPVVIIVLRVADYDEEISGAVLLLLVWVLAAAHAQVVEATARGLERMDIAATMAIAGAAQILAAGTIAVVLFSSVKAVAVVMIAERLVTAGLGLALLRRDERTASVHDDQEHRGGTRALIAGSLPFAGIGITTIIHQRVDLLMMPAYTDATDVGQYAAASRAFEVAVLIPAIVGAAAFPRMVRAGAHDLTRVLRGSLRRTMIPTVAATLVGLAVMPALIEGMLGGGFADGGRWVQILLLALPFAALTENLGWALVARKHEARLLAISCALIALNVVLNLVLLPRFGGSGAAAATVATFAVSVLLHAWAFADPAGRHFRG